jgi:hypothetical protein
MRQPYNGRRDGKKQENRDQDNPDHTAAEPRIDHEVKTPVTGRDVLHTPLASRSARAAGRQTLADTPPVSSFPQGKRVQTATEMTEG